MGIKGLNQFLRKRCPMVFHKETPLSTFAFKKVAVDISTYIYKYKSIFGDKWFRSFIHLICTLRKHKLHPVIIFDGPPLKEKKDEQKKRTKKREDLKNKIKTIRKDLDLFYRTGNITELLKTCTNKRKTPDKLKRFLGVNTFDPKPIEEYLESIAKQIIYIRKDEIDICQAILKLFKIPYIKAKDDAERLCVQLYKQKKVEVILSDDSDVIAYGVDCILSNLNIKNGTVTFINANEIIYHLELKNKEELLDFCIMCGTDYNDNIKKVGPVNVYKLIKKYGKIDDFDMKIPFDYKNIRSLFTPIETTDSIPYCERRVNFKDVQQYLLTKRIYVDLDFVQKAFSPVKVKCLN